MKGDFISLEDCPDGVACGLQPRIGRPVGNG